MNKTRMSTTDRTYKEYEITLNICTLYNSLTYFSLRECDGVLKKAGDDDRTDVRLAQTPNFTDLDT